MTCRIEVADSFVRSANDVIGLPEGNSIPYELTCKDDFWRWMLQLPTRVSVSAVTEQGFIRVACAEYRGERRLRGKGEVYLREVGTNTVIPLGKGKITVTHERARTSGTGVNVDNSRYFGKRYD